MLTDLIEVFTCSNVTCPNGPPWYELAENWAAHLGIGGLLGWIVHRRWAWAILAPFVLKEVAFDIPGDPRLSTIMDSFLDLAATALVLWALARTSQLLPSIRIKPLTRL